MIQFAGPIFFEGWAPDSQHLIVKESDGFRVLDANGDEVASVAADQGFWTSPTSIAAFGNPGPGSAIDQVRFLDLTGNQVSKVDEDFERVVFLPNSVVFAGVKPATGRNAVGTKYRIWDGSALSEIRDGEAEAWAPDGSRLAVLMQLKGSEGQAPEGSLAIVDAAGSTLYAQSDLVGGTYDFYGFSPDSRYLAACVVDRGAPTGSAGALQYPEIRVVDTQTMAVSAPNARCGYVRWIAANTLYTSVESEPTQIWTPANGVQASGYPAGTNIAPFGDGNLATWTAGSGTLHVTKSGTTRDYQLSGGSGGDVLIGDVEWAPDGNVLSVTTAPVSSGIVSDYGLTIIRLDAGQ